MAAQYPPEDFDRGITLMQQLGSFWNLIFQDADRLQAHIRSSGNEHGQTYLDFLEAVACVSRLNVPVFHTENWYLMTLKRSDCAAVMSIYEPNDLVYGYQPSGGGRPAGFMQVYGGEDWPGVVQAVLPPPLVDVPFTIHNLVVNPSLTLVRGTDYDVDADRGTIRFKADPFANPLVPRRDIVDANGNVTDTEIALWVYKGQFDLDYVYMQFGYALGMQMKSSQGYKDLLNAFWDMYVLGPSLGLLSAFMSALSGAQTCLDATETVAVVLANEMEQVVVTDTHVYKFPLAAGLLVAVGDEIHAGAPLSDAFVIRELSGVTFDLSLLSALSITDRLASGPFTSSLTFRNHDAALTYVGVEDGKAMVTFETSGFPGDIDAFWDDVQARGVAAGKTLANYLDVRATPVGEPGPASLPATINPAEFIVGQLMKSNLFVIRLRLASFWPDSPGVAVLGRLREVIPPHTTFLIYLELSPGPEVVDLSQPGGEDVPGAEERIGKFLGVSVLDQAYDISIAPPGAASYEDAFVAAAPVSVECLK